MKHLEKMEAQHGRGIYCDYFHLTLFIVVSHPLYGEAASMPNWPQLGRL